MGWLRYYPSYAALKLVPTAAGNSICRGDSGGPTLLDGKIVGVNSTSARVVPRAKCVREPDPSLRTLVDVRRAYDESRIHLDDWTQLCDEESFEKGIITLDGGCYDFRALRERQGRTRGLVWSGRMFDMDTVSYYTGGAEPNSHTLAKFACDNLNTFPVYANHIHQHKKGWRLATEGELKGTRPVIEYLPMGEHLRDLYWAAAPTNTPKRPAVDLSGPGTTLMLNDAPFDCELAIRWSHAAAVAPHAEYINNKIRERGTACLSSPVGPAFPPRIPAPAPPSLPPAPVPLPAPAPPPSDKVNPTPVTPIFPGQPIRK